MNDRRDSGRESLSIIGIVLLVGGVGMFAHSMGWLAGMGLDLWDFWPLAPLIIGLRALGNTTGIARLFAVLLTGAGALGLAATLSLLPADMLASVSVTVDGISFSQIVAAVMVLLGLGFLLGGKRFFIGSRDIDGERLGQAAIFGGYDISVSSQRFAGGWLFAMFGGFEIDLTEARAAADEITLECVALFGGGEIHVPEGWKVEMSGLPIFGGFGSKVRHDPASPGPHPVLRINAVAMFGGFEVNNG